MRQSRTRSGGVEGHHDSLAGAAVAQEHGAAGISRGTIGTRQADLAHLTRTRHAQATPRVFVSEA
jgi:hypothetical protein